MQNRFQTASSTARRVVGLRGQVCTDTVRRRLRAAGLRARRPYVGPVLTGLHRQRRLQWAAVHRRWTRRQWNAVVFFDESRFTLSRADERVRVWRRLGERYSENCVLQADRFGGGSVMVWAAFSHDHVAVLRRTLQREWTLIPQAYFRTLVNSMRTRCQACIAANGGHTRF